MAERRLVQGRAIRQRQRNEEAALLTTSQRPDDNRNFVPGFDTIGAPSLPRKIPTRVVSFERSNIAKEWCADAEPAAVSNSAPRHTTRIFNCPPQRPIS